MPRPCSFSLLYDNLQTLNIKDLKKWGYLNFDSNLTGVITWKTNDQVVAQINIKTDPYESPKIILSYFINGAYVKYSVGLISKPSNLQNGSIWFFICPKTKMLSRKLYLVDGYFYHREAHNGCMYESQTRSKKTRELIKLFNSI